MGHAFNEVTLESDHDPALLRRALSQLATSVTVVTTTHEGRQHGFTANSFTSVSVNPPLVLACLADTAECYDAFSQTDRVAINVLSEGQAEHARLFATRGADKFGQVEVDSGRFGVPVIRGAMVTIEGTIHDRVVAGDHLMILVRVEHVSLDDSAPLTYQARAFKKLG
ncbi:MULTISPECIES: flavin reductase family protein [Subtercola]|nr:MULTISPECIES: flavin reductase family protein [Subtercola]MEA9984663.1 flavin reductase family protein [Subtercola sp. RTI3]